MCYFTLSSYLLQYFWQFTNVILEELFYHHELLVDNEFLGQLILFQLSVKHAQLDRAHELFDYFVSKDFCKVGVHVQLLNNFNVFSQDVRLYNFKVNISF